MSCSEDRSIRTWHVSDFGEKTHQYDRANVELDHATHIAFTADGRYGLVLSLYSFVFAPCAVTCRRAAVCALSSQKKMRAFKVSKREMTAATSFPEVCYMLGIR